MTKPLFALLSSALLLSAPCSSHDSVTSADVAFTADILTLNVILALHLLFYISLFVLAAWLGRRHLQSSHYWAHASNVDSLTGLLNRRGLAYTLARKTQQGEHRGCLFLVDIDNFKQINDQYGHDQGDAVLTQVADALKATLRSDDVICRLGGEEFAIFSSLANAPSNSEPAALEKAQQQAQRLVDAVRQHCRIPAAADSTVTVSIGVTNYQTLHNWEQQSYPQADAALYHAKRNGKNQASVNQLIPSSS